MSKVEARAKAWTTLARTVAEMTSVNSASTVEAVLGFGSLSCEE
jgi:hypothetical protein